MHIGASRVMVLALKDSSFVYLEFADEPVIIPASEHLTIKSDKAVFEYSASSVKKVYFLKDSSDIPASIKVVENKVKQYKEKYFLLDGKSVSSLGHHNIYIHIGTDGKIRKILKSK